MNKSLKEINENTNTHTDNKENSNWGKSGNEKLKKNLKAHLTNRIQQMKDRISDLDDMIE